MSKSDWLTVGVTLLSVSLSWALGGQYAAHIAGACLVAGIGVLAYAHMKPQENKPQEPFTTIGPIIPVSTDKAAPKNRVGMRMFLDEITMGLKMGATEKAYLFLRCRVVSPHKTTSLTKITATAIFQNSARLPCELLEDLSDWLIAPERGNDLEIEPLSLWSRLRKETLTAEVQKEEGRMVWARC